MIRRPSSFVEGLIASLIASSLFAAGGWIVYEPTEPLRWLALLIAMGAGIVMVLFLRTVDPRTRVPRPFSSYLEIHQEFARAEDLDNKLVRTSAESFFDAARLILESLEPGTEVWSTDNVRLSPDFSAYWIHEGLRYLAINHEASGRGVIQHRIFLIKRDEFQRHRARFKKLFVLHSMAGVTVHIAFWERVPSSYRIDMAIWGDKFADEVVYDLRGEAILDNLIHWKPTVVARFANKISVVRELVEDSQTTAASRTSKFESVREHAAQMNRRSSAQRGLKEPA